MPDSIDQYLLRTEQTIFAVRRHWAALAKDGATLLGFWVGALIVLALLHGVELIKLVAIFFIFFSAGWFAWLVGDWYVERFVVTNKRVLLVSGLLTRRVAIMPLIKVTDLTYEQSIAGRMLGYGAFVIESAGQHQALSRVDFLSEPNRRYHQVSALLFGTEADADPEDRPAERATDTGAAHPTPLTASARSRPSPVGSLR